MNQLPSEMIRMILTNLNVQDKMQCRSINKKFKSIIDNNLKFDQLTILSDSEDMNDNWYYTNKPRNENFLVFIESKFFETDLFEKSIFERIKRLFINAPFKFKLDIEKTINKLNQLKELTIHSDIKEGQMKLVHLKILNLENNIEENIRLNTPNLSILKSRAIKMLDFVYPDRIKYLDLMYDDPCFEKFINLEYLHCFEYSKLRLETLTKLNKLKEMHTDWDEDSNLSYFERIINEKKRSKLKNLKLFVYGLEFQFYQSIPDHHYDYPNEILTVLKNYSKSINVIPSIRRINYNDLLILFKVPSKIPSDLFYKFPNIKEVHCPNVVDDIDHFLKFLKNLSSLTSLELSCKLLNDQHYYDQLPQLLPKLTTFRLTDSLESVRIETNFILKFKYLKSLSLGKKVDKKFIMSLYADLKYFYLISFHYQDIRASILYARYDDTYRLGMSTFRFFSLNDIINHLEEKNLIS